MKNSRQNIVITGVSRGLGHALASQWLNRGANVYGCSRRKPEDLMEREHFHHVEVDLGHADAETTLRSFLSDVKSIDVAVLNAASLGEIRDLQKTPLSDLKHMAEINLWANKWLIDLLVSENRRVDLILAISSGAAVNAYRGWGGYCLTKAALNMLVALYAPELPDTRILALAPGLVDTAMQDYLTSLPDDERYGAVQRLKEAKKRGTMLPPDKTAATILNLIPTLNEKPSGSFQDVRDLA